MSETHARIRLLPESLINQIAAGEVVERPAAVLKELIENCLDAGAGRIEIDCEQAGMRLIRVRDDGRGIAPEDLALALCRHATSKISNIDDLDRIASMGFRGEALPSIGAVSRLTLISRRSGADTAWQAGLEGRADVSGPVPASHPLGTTVEVRELFFNTPARRRFLRSERTEMLHIQQTVRNLALSRPAVGIRLTHNRQSLMQLPAADDAAAIRARLARLYGAAFEQTALPIAEEAGRLRVSGWISPVASARNQSDLQTLFVNGRPIRDQGLQHAIRLAYQDELPDGRFPAYVIYLSVPTEEVDVNVHPAKSEVRFRDPRQVHDFLLSALRARLLTENTDDPLAAPAKVPVQGGRAPIPTLPPEAAAGAADTSGGVLPARRSDRLEPLTVREGGQPYRATRRPSAGARSADAVPAERVLSLLDRRILIVSEDSTLTIIDFETAYAMLNRMRLIAAMGEAATGGRPLLFPLTELTEATEQARRESSVAALAQCGFDLLWEPAGRLVLRGVPMALPDADPQDLLAAIASVLPRSVESPGSEAWLAALADAVPVPADCNPQWILDEIRRRRIDTSCCQRRFCGEDLRRLLAPSG